MAKDKRKADVLHAARDYAALAMEHLVACLEVDEDDIELLDIHLQTTFLFPTLSDAERSRLCRLRFLGHYLYQARSTKPFGLTRQRLQRYASKLRRLAAEREVLKRRLARSSIRENLTPAQQEALKTYLRIAPMERG